MKFDIQKEIKYINPYRMNILDKLNRLLYGQFKLTGALSLLFHGIIERHINDIDIVVDSFDILKLLPKDVKPEYTYDYNEKEPEGFIEILVFKFKRFKTKLIKSPNRAYFELDGYKVDVFLGKDQDYVVGEFSVDRKFKISDPKYSIEAKEKYMKDLYNMLFKNKKLTEAQKYRYKKHQADYKDYKKWLYAKEPLRETVEKDEQYYYLEF